MLFALDKTETHLELKFHAPETSNALSLEAARELAAITKRFKKWPKPVVVRSAHPRIFCSGGNLTAYAKMKSKAPGLKVNREITRHLNAFAAWPAVKLAVIEGDVFGGGMEWLARFDFRWSTPAAVFAFWQKRIGLSTGWGGGRAWAERIGEDRLRRLLLDCHLLSAAEAQRLGLIDRIVTSWAMDESIAEWSRMAGDAAHLTGWSVKGEEKVFSSLWNGPKHQAALKKWR